MTIRNQNLKWQINFQFQFKIANDQIVFPTVILTIPWNLNFKFLIFQLVIDSNCLLLVNYLDRMVALK